ncbi:MAG: DUF1015 domain-containing protein [Candidatus Aminicenantes bacterium]|nr:DUF1015 domain-containing protein [Candidatus Aminicenantes bacterium]
MVRIEPFKGLRPRKDIVQLVASPPYDVLNKKEAKELASGNDYSFLHIIKPEIDLPDTIDAYSDQVYEKAKSNFDRFIKENILIQDKKNHFYIYKQIWDEHTQVGIVASASVQNYEDNIIKKHEFTRENKEIDRMRHIEILNANTGPVFLTFKQNDRIENLINKAMEQEPEYKFQSQDTVIHIFYVVHDPELIQRIQFEFSKLNTIYVADGHHRSAAATRIKQMRQSRNKTYTGNEEYNFFLSVIFPHNQMKILAYNRVVKDLNHQNKAELFHKISKNFSFQETEIKTPRNPHEFCLYIEGKWYQLKAESHTFNAEDPVESLDVSILQKNLLNPILDIKDPRTDNRIAFVGGIRGSEELEKKVNSGDYQIGFSLFPTSIGQLFRVADSGNVMPPKSTWFEPKLKSGLVVHLLD